MPAPETRFAVLLFTDIVGSTELKAGHGVPAYSTALRTHNGHFERLARECHIRILHNMGDGYFAEAGSVAEAVRFALLFQDAMRAGPWSDVPLTTRVGIHAGEIGTVDSEGGSGVVAPAADLAARVMSLAVGGQILLTRFPFDEARHFIREHPPVSGKTMPPLSWLAHGPYLLKGRDEPMDIFEVGAEGLAPLTAPPDGDKAKRAIRPGEEETLGWRPAVGLEIPGRTGWQLTERLGAGGFGEVWTGEHAKLRQRRAFKFCFDDERLRALKREVTFNRLLYSALGERDDIVHIHELKLDAPPFYLESDLAPHGNLLQWAESQGGLDKIPLAQRIALVAHTATALAAAHSIGVLHKDIKPTNILIFDGPNGEPRPRLVDFGIGTLADPAVLGEHGVTPAGFTRATIQHSTGAPTYSPPEYLAGKAYTIQGDIYGLGVLLYQLITVKPLDPLAPGWERDIPDPLLRADIATCVDGDPARRFPSAADLAERLLHLDQRRADILEKERIANQAAARDEAETAAIAARTRARRFRRLAAAFAVLALLAILAGVAAWNENAENRRHLHEASMADYAVAVQRLDKDDRWGEGIAHLARALDWDPENALAAIRLHQAVSSANATPVAVFHDGLVTSASFSPDGSRIVTTSGDKTARVWEAASGKAVGEPMRHEWNVTSASFSPDGSRIVTASYDGTARVWDAASGKAVGEPIRHEEEVMSTSFSPDGSRIMTTSWHRTARVWDAASGKAVGEPMCHDRSVTSASFRWKVESAGFSPDGSRIVTASGDETARVWDAASGKAVGEPIRREGPVSSASFSPDGSRIVTASGDKTARVWDAASGKAVGEPMRHEREVTSASFSPDGSRIVTASGDKTARVWEAASGKAVGEPMRHKGEVTSASFSPDGSRIVTTSYGGTARVWDAASGKAVGEPMRHERNVTSASFSPDGSRIVTTSGDKTARVWDAASGKAVGEPMRHEREVTSASFSPDGSRIVTTSYDGTARVWDAASGKTVGEPMSHESRVNCASFSPDGSRIVTASDDRTARVWDAPIPGETLLPVPAWVRDWARAVCGLRFESDGALQSVSAKERITALNAPPGGDDEWSRLARWLATDPAKRTIRLHSPNTRREIASRERNFGTMDSLESALRYDPTVPLARLMLAKFEPNPQRADFLRDYELKHLPDDAALWARAAASLVEQKDFPRALTAAGKALSLDPKNETAQRARVQALEAQTAPK